MLDAHASLAYYGSSLGKGSRIGFPRPLLPSLHELGAQVLERRGVDADPAALARDLLAGLDDLCLRTGQDGVLAGLAASIGYPDDERAQHALAELLADRTRFDPGGPRNAMPAQLAACLLAALSLELEDPPDRSIALSDELRREVIAALAAVADAELAPASVRAAIIAGARARCAGGHLKAFDKMAAQLDETATRLPPQPKVPLNVVREVQQALHAERVALLERVANAAIDRAAPVLARGSEEAAARIEQPITHRLTAREVAVRRAAEVRVPASSHVVHALIASLTELLSLAWAAPAVSARPYAISQTFAVGDVIEHPKFGRGTVKASTVKNIEVEFADGAHTLVHARR